MTTQTEQPTTQTPPAGGPPPRHLLPRRKKPDTLPRLDHCLNCGAATGAADNYCPHCGQENQNETVALRPFVADLMSEVASWDSKLARTAVPLLFRPGFLTNEYNAGRRVRYLSPLKMYLVISALFFLVLPSNPIASRMHVDPDGVRVGDSNDPAKVAKKRHPVASDHTNITTNFNFNGQPTEMSLLPKTVGAYEAQQKGLPPARRDSVIKRLAKRQLIKAKGNQQTFVQSLAQGFIGALPKMMFALLPLFAALLKVTYWRRKRLYVEHLIFALHAHAFTFAVLTLAVLLSQTSLPKGVIWTTFVVLLPMYLLVALRRVYEQGWGKTLFKFTWLAWNYFLLLSLAFVVTVLVAFFLA